MKASIETADHMLTLRVEGDLNAHSAPDLRPTIDDIVEGRRPKLVVVDLSALRMIDSSGVGAIVSLYKRLRHSGADLRLGGLAGQPLAIFRVLRLDRVMKIVS